MKNVLIVGGSSDIGRSLALFLKNNGYNPIITYHKRFDNIDGIEFIKCNIKNENDIDRMFKYVYEKYGKIDILINMAAISMDNSFLNKTKKEFMEVLEVNLVGTFLCCQYYSRYYNDGLIINIGSTDGIDTNSIYSIDYSASKAGIINMTKSISLSSLNKVICVCPNWIDSDSTRDMDLGYLRSELKRIGQGRLITTYEFNYCMYKIMNMKIVSGSIFRIDIKGDKLWMKKVL